MDSCLCNFVCKDGTVIGSLPQLKIHSLYMKELIEDEIVCRCTATMIILADLLVVNVHVALGLLRSDSDVCVVRVPSEWRDIVTPCYALLRIPWTEEREDLLDIHQIKLKHC